jgi:DNA-binding LacI/PurR family transcriptional regulator
MQILVIAPGPPHVVASAECFYKHFRPICPKGVYASLVSSIDGSNENIERHLLVNDNYDAAVIIEPDAEFSASRSALLKNLPIAVVRMQAPSQEPQIVTVDASHGVHTAITHLLNLGHQCIGILLPTGRSDYVSACETGYSQAFSKSPGKYDNKLILHVDGAEIGAYEATMELFSNTRPSTVTALVAADTMTLLGADLALKSLRLLVPSEVSLLGIQAPVFTPPVLPGITTVTFSARAAAEASFRSIMGALDGMAVPEQIIRPKLIVEQSTARA